MENEQIVTKYEAVVIEAEKKKAECLANADTSSPDYKSICDKCAEEYHAMVDPAKAEYEAELAK